MSETTSETVTLVSKDGKTKVDVSASDKGEINRLRQVGYATEEVRASIAAARQKTADDAEAAAAEAEQADTGTPATGPAVPPSRYAGVKKADLEDEVEERNLLRGDDTRIVVEGNGNVADLTAALEADDADGRVQ